MSHGWDGGGRMPPEPREEPATTPHSRNSTDVRTCDTCVGTGRITHDLCSGTGDHPLDPGDCYGCGGSGSVICARCQGTGRIARDYRL